MVTVSWVGPGSGHPGWVNPWAGAVQSGECHGQTAVGWLPLPLGAEQKQQGGLRLGTDSPQAVPTATWCPLGHSAGLASSMGAPHRDLGWQPRWCQCSRQGEERLGAAWRLG